MGFLRDTLWGGIVVGARALGAIIINKLFAVVFGEAGVVMLAHFQNLLAIFIAIPTEGVNRGMMTLINNQQNQNRRNMVFVAGWVANMLLVVTVVVVLLIAPNFFIIRFLPNEYGFFWIIIGLLSFALHISNMYFLSTILSVGDNRLHGVYSVFQIGIAVVVVTIGAFTNNLHWALLFYLVGHSLIGIATYTYTVQKNYWVLSNVTLKDILSNIKPYGGFLLMALSTAIFGRATEFWVRSFAIDQLGITQTGYWQACFRVADGYIMVLTSFIGLVLFPGMTQRQSDKTELQKWFNKAVSRAIVLAIPLFGTIWIFKDLVVTILNSSDFITGSYLLDYILPADFIRMLCYFIATYFWLNKKVWLMVISEVFSATVYLLLVYYLTPKYGVVGLTLAHGIRFVFYFIYLLIVFRRELFTR